MARPAVPKGGHGSLVLRCVPVSAAHAGSHVCARTEGVCKHAGVYTRVCGEARDVGAAGAGTCQSRPRCSHSQPRHQCSGSLCQGCARAGLGVPVPGPCQWQVCAFWIPVPGPCQGWVWGSPCSFLGTVLGTLPSGCLGDGFGGQSSSTGAPGPVALLGLWFLCGAGLSLPPSQPCVCSSLGAGGGPEEARAGCGCGACNPLGPGAQLCCSTLLSPQPPDGSPPRHRDSQGLHPSIPPPRSSPGTRTPRRRCSTCCPRRWWHVTCASTPRPGSRTALSACGQRSWAARCQVGARCLLPLAPTHECPGRARSAGANPRAGVRIVPTSRDL